ncbi:MAG: polysaccharide deacetylase family protein [Planctomycetota bacterium]|nr:polysaccharide deacetylase family protein [Planctomycetota bacterium]
MNLPTHGRYDYSPIGRRPDFRWPDGKRLAVYLGVNLEHFAFGEGLGAELAPGGPQPDVLNYAWRDYGNRIGAWRMLDLFDSLDLPCSVLVNSSILDYCPELVEAHAQRGDEICGHGRTNSERQSTLDQAAEAALIAEATTAIASRLGVRPKGWLGPWIAESRVTPDLLKEAGYAYLLDWSHDDQPVWMQTRAGPILSVPYPQEINDIPAIAVRRASAAEFADMIIDNFDEMLDQSERQSMVMGIALHPYVVGQPYRLRHLRRALAHVARRSDTAWIATAGQIANHYTSLFPLA